MAVTRVDLHRIGSHELAYSIGNPTPETLEAFIRSIPKDELGKLVVSESYDSPPFPDPYFDPETDVMGDTFFVRVQRRMAKEPGE